MAQRTGKEDTDFKVPETLTLCINNCGVTGNPATNNMCQTCFNATTFTFTSTSTSTSFSPTATTASAGPSILKLSDDQSSRSTPSRLQDNRSASALPKTAATTKNSRTFASNRSGKTDPSAAAEKQVVNRCSGCRKRVGLTGFRCRCGELFCAEHRYWDRHDCSYDYKAAGREAIARENPIVKAAKIIRV